MQTRLHRHAQVLSAYSCGRGSTYSAFSILAALLIAGQAVTVYFVYQHNGQISKLTKNTQELQLDSLANKLPHSELRQTSPVSNQVLETVSFHDSGFRALGFSIGFLYMLIFLDSDSLARAPILNLHAAIYYTYLSMASSEES
uniref:MHC class II-associated invariant chain/CLIP MHC II-interacting domain-containing protein n=1 Tax=Varanus komodoensis TaxID=61221 RepID=A0A8D2KSH4_VARKO